MVLNVGITSPAFSMPAMTRGSEYARKCVFEAFHSHHCRGFLMNGTGLAYELFSDSTMIFSVYSALNCSTPAVPREKGKRMFLPLWNTALVQRATSAGPASGGLSMARLSKALPW